LLFPGRKQQNPHHTNHRRRRRRREKEIYVICPQHLISLDNDCARHLLLLLRQSPSHFSLLFSSFVSVPAAEPIWSIDKQHDTGTLFWRRDSSRVKFRCEVEVLEFVRDPDELKFMLTRDYVENSSHPLVVIATCVFAIAVTVFLPWVLMGSTSVIQ
jgi:hypothetical protein